MCKDVKYGFELHINKKEREDSKLTERQRGFGSHRRLYPNISEGNKNDIRSQGVKEASDV